MAPPALLLDDGLISRAEAAIELLKRHRQSVVTAESCTAGLIAAALSYGRSASECFHGGFVAYSKAQKTTALGVSPALLQRQGSVNAEVAEQLATGALAHSSATIAVAITGVVGPNPDEDGAQPGHAFFAIAHQTRMLLLKEEYLRLETPDEVRRALTERALELLKAAAQGSFGSDEHASEKRYRQ